MLAVLADTHAAADPRLRGRTATAVADADRVVHAGDLTTAAVLDRLADAAGGPVHAVHGNADDPAVRDRLPATRTLAHGGVRIVVTHTREGGRTALSMLGRARDAALVVSGHTHRPAVVDGPPTLLNPGSHAAPRGGAPAAHAELRAAEDGLDGTVRAADGTVVERFAVGRPDDAGTERG
ncbi:MAG: YfcE family phosphodiesterase [Haloferacaceae archaeon]